MVDRKANIDLLRVISAAAIVILQSVTAPLGNASSPIPLLTEQILTVIHSLTLWAVPAFFIITGYCLLLKPECSYKYCFFTYTEICNCALYSRTFLCTTGGGLLYRYG